MTVLYNLMNEGALYRDKFAWNCGFVNLGHVLDSTVANKKSWHTAQLLIIKHTN